MAIRSRSPGEVGLRAAPIILQFLFLVYPIVTRHAFEAFSWYEFTDDGHFLRADVSIEHGSSAHATASGMAVTAIICYPVGLLLVFGGVLLHQRHPILSGPPTGLSTAIRFLYGAFEPQFFWWELVEMSRRFLLVGVYVTVRQGTIEQLLYGSFTALLYLALQVQATPYKERADDFFASVCSLLLVVLFMAAIPYKYAALTDSNALQATMSNEQRTDFLPPYVVLSAVMLAACVGVLAVLAVILALKMREDRARMRREALAAESRRLCWLANDSQVVLDRLADGQYHLFLSHVCANFELCQLHHCHPSAHAALV